jgi:hypothetical protein
MLHSADMQLAYWGEAFMYAIHVCSLMLTSGLDIVGVSKGGSDDGF